jgi:murein DD-endopeptidase MepM/ murein hydrolase activator NlpD
MTHEWLAVLVCLSLLIPYSPTKKPSELNIFPDSEVVYGPTTVAFDAAATINRFAGAMARQREYLKSNGWNGSAGVLMRVARENSINPRLLLSLLEFECGCVLGQREDAFESGYVLGYQDYRRRGLYRQLWWAANQLSAGYYGWREGRLKQIDLPDGTVFKLAPGSNAGTVALQYYFAQSWAAHRSSNSAGGHGRAWWESALDQEEGLPALHRRMFAESWAGAVYFEPAQVRELRQPEMILPFEPGRLWSLTSGPHQAWETLGSQAALDFAPASDKSGCLPTDAWVTAVADGRISRSENGMVILDLDEAGRPSDGREQTGWAVLYMHIAAAGRATAGQRVRAGERIGQPSCEGGPSTGLNLHLARKYNGEWMAAGGAVPFVMDGWRAEAGTKPYEGILVKGEQKVVANLYGNMGSHIQREEGQAPVVPTP